MSIVTYEVNSKRKSQRVDIPIYLEIKNRLYKVKDWSLAGMAIVTKDDLDLKQNDTIKGTIVLPLKGAKLNLDTLLKFINYRDDTYGFEYRGMSEKNKNVLRHFIQLAIEGKADSVQDLLSDYSMPEIKSPIKEPIALSDNEKKELQITFKKNIIYYTLMGIILFSLIAVTLFYNLAVFSHTQGVVSGNYEKYYAGSSGVIEIMDVNENDKILKNSILFNIKSNKTPSNSNLVFQEEIKSLEERKKSYEEELEALKPSSKHNLISINAELPELKRVLDNAKKEYDNAKKLFDGKLLIKSEFEKVKERYLSAKSRYSVALTKKSAIKSEIKDNLEAKRKDIEQMIEILDSKIETKKLSNTNKLVENLDNLPSIARSDGVINYIKFRKGEFVNSSDLIMILETNTKPYILIKIPLELSLNFNTSVDCVVSSKINNRKFKGVISKIDYVPRDSISSIVKNLNSNEVIIKVDLVDDLARLPLNSRVDIWITKNNSIGKFFVENIFFTNNQLLASIAKRFSW